MFKKPSSLRIAVAALLGAAVCFPGPAGIDVQADVNPPLPRVPVHLPHAQDDGSIYLPDADGTPRPTTLKPALQQHLEAFLIDARSPIAAIVVADAKDGSILAMAQGRDPKTWGGERHTALHTAFPAASLFKTVVTAAAFEMADFNAIEPVGLTGGCAHVRETGEWLKERGPNNLDRMNLRRAFGTSCNGFFAKIAVNNLGLGIITDFARRFGWESGVPADFALDKSPFYPPSPQNSSTSTVGRFAAGFGYVGISAVHAASMMLAIANDGLTTPVRLFRDSPGANQSQSNSDVSDAAQPSTPGRERIFSERTAQALKEILDSSTHGGTATQAFRRGKYRKLRDLVGGKTGTLTGSAPKGLTTWFAGMAPLDKPEIVVAAVVVLDDLWYIKGPNLAAEGVWAYYDQKIKERATVPVIPVSLR